MIARSGSASSGWLALLPALVLAGLLGLLGGAAGNAQAALPEPAPALTQQQLAQLQAVTSWDFEYTGSKSVKYTGGGGSYQAFSGFTVSSWDESKDLSWTVHAKGTVSGPAGCEFVVHKPLPCGLDYEQSGTYAQTYHSTDLGHWAWQNIHCPDGSLITDALTSTDITADGGYVPDGTTDRSALGGFAIDYAANPPRALSDLGYASAPGLRVDTGGACGDFPSQSFEVGAGSLGLGVAFAFGDPASQASFGDTQVQVDRDGSFLITGFHDSSVPVVTCFTPVPPGFGVLPCQTTGSSTMTDQEHDVWTLRPHVDCPPIPEDKLADAQVADDLKDGDGDGIPDCWEQHGIQIEKADGSVITYDLPDADPRHKDLYLEVDYMAGHAPASGSVADVVQAFARAPVSNLDGHPGITLHVPDGEQVPEVPRLQLHPSLPGDLNDFADIKSTTPSSGSHCGAGFFGTPAERDDPDCVLKLLAKRLVYRYALFADSQENAADGKANTSSGVSELPGNDFMVTLGGWDPASINYAGGQRAAEAATFMHELGHALGLGHGGGDSVNCKPNYLSVMNYIFQFAYANRDPNRPLDYSTFALPVLNEASLDEPSGIGGPAGWLAVWGQGGLLSTAPANAAIDWNASGATTDLGVSANVNRIDSINDCAAQDGRTIDGRYGRITYDSNLDPASVPARSAFTIIVNGAEQTPVNVRIVRNLLYLTVASPVSAADTVAFKYVQPATGPVLRGAGGGAIASSQSDAVNISGQRQSLSGFADWSNLRYSFRDTPGFADGQGVDAHPSVADLTSAEVVATAQPADAAAPTSSVTAAPAANTAGWNNSDVTLSLSAVDETGGSGVREIDYSASGAQPLGLTKVNASSAQLTISAEGSTTLSYFAVDNAGNTESPKTITIKVDRKVPALTVPAAMTVNATSPAGAVVGFSPTAIDRFDPSPSIACAPASGSTFAIGQNRVSCTATDQAGNTSAPGTFSVTVKGAPAQIADLVDELLTMLNRPVLSAPLKASLQSASQALIARKPSAACSALGSFITVVKLTPSPVLTTAQRKQLIDDTTRIRAVIPC